MILDIEVNGAGSPQDQTLAGPDALAEVPGLARVTDEGCHGAVAAATHGILAYPAGGRIGPHLHIECAFILVFAEDEDARGLGLKTVALHRLQGGTVLQDCLCAGQLRDDPTSAYINQAGCELTHDRGSQARFQAVDLPFVQRRDLGIGQLEGDLLVSGVSDRFVQLAICCICSSVRSSA